MKRSRLLLIVTLALLALGTGAACLVRTRPAHSHHGSTVRGHGHEHGKHKKHKKVKKHKKYKD